MWGALSSCAEAASAEEAETASKGVSARESASIQPLVEREKGVTIAVPAEGDTEREPPMGGACAKRSGAYARAALMPVTMIPASYWAGASCCSTRVTLLVT